MGKDSLIKSTAKKKAKEEDKKTKKTTVKKKATKARPKSKTTKSAKKKSPPKKKSAAKAVKKKTPVKSKTAAKKPSPKKTKSTAKKTTKPKTKTAVKKPAKKLSAKELLLKSFAPISETKPPQQMSRPAKTAPSAPPWVSTDDPRAERVRALLHQSFSMSVVRAAAASPKVRPVADVEPPAKEALEAAPKATPAPASAGAPPSNGFSSATERPSPAMPDPISKTVKMVAAGFGVLILLILMTSHNNSKKYYIQPIDNAIEIRKGLFSPKDNDFFMVLHGTQLTGSVKDVYSKEEVYPLIFNYYLEKADTLLEVPGLPDFEGIKIYLKEARKFAISKKMHQTVAIRLNTIERMILLYRADVAISKGTVQSLDNAIKYLNGAQKFTTTPAHGQEIQQKLNLATSLKAALETKANRKGK